jgi:transposase
MFTTARPKIRHEYRRNAPKHAPCPHCGTPGHRKDFHARTVRGIAYQAILLIHLTTAEYRATCACCTTFRTQLPDIEPKAKYSNAVRDAVIDRLLDDHMSLERIQASLQRDFFLDLSPGFIYDCLRWKVRQLDMADYRRWTLQQFSGTLCIDEIHLGDLTLLLATDPLRDFPVAFALVSANDHDHMDRFLRQLRDHGFDPKVVVTDGSGLYPALLAVIWPHAEHQLCVFHVMQDINDEVLDAVKRLRRELARRGNRGRKRRRGRPKAKANRRRRLSAKDKAHFIFKHRYLIVKRREKLSKQQVKDLQQMLEYLPALRELRRFVDQTHPLFEAAQTRPQAWVRYAAWQADADFAAVPELARVQQNMTAAKFAKVVAFLGSPAGGRVRTNNHVERMNRQLRHYEKVRYKWRTARGVVRFMVLTVDRLWRQRQLASGPQVFQPGGESKGPAPKTAQVADGVGVDRPPAEAEAA